MSTAFKARCRLSRRASSAAIFRISRLLLTRLLVAGALLLQHRDACAQDSSHIRISLLTCTPGEELYSTFGHTAIRVTDSINLADYDNVFNYGTFNFEDPGFYTKFVRGKLLYYLSVERFSEFKYSYQLENRGITEQVLNMSPAEKIALMDALYENAKEENRYYQYDFFLDNCTTRARDVLIAHTKDHQTYKPVMPPGTRFRQAIHQYLDQNKKYWSKLGIDLLLGARTDAVMTIPQSQFLPDNLMKSFEIINRDHQLILSTTDLYPVNRQDNKGSFITPMLAFSLLFAIILLISLSKGKPAITFLQGFDGVLFFLTGAMGILIVLMWCATDHSMTKDNYNLIWAWPTHLISAFFVNNRKEWVRKYFGFTTAGLLIVLMSWFFLPQQLNNALLPFVMLLTFRSATKFFIK